MNLQRCVCGSGRVTFLLVHVGTRTLCAALSLALLHTWALGAAPSGFAPAAAPTGEETPAGVSADWWHSVQRDLGRSEYEIQERSTGACYEATNRAQNFRTVFSPDGIRVQPRTPRADEAAAWEWGLTLAGWGRDGALTLSAALPELEASGNRIVYRHGGLVEWYVNDAEGLEQGFTIEAAPGPAGQLRLNFAVTGSVTTAFTDGGQAIDFLAVGGAQAIHFGSLYTVDRNGRTLPSRFEGAPGGDLFSIVVDDTGAEYPITIDPLATSPAWTAESDQAGAGMAQVATAGDVNGDGYSDVIVGAHLYDNGETDEGKVWVFHGSAAGLASTAAWSAECDQAGANFGIRVATAGDVNGDGYSDVMVGAWLYDHGQANEGTVFVWYGSATGLGSNGTPANADWSAESDQLDADLGISVAPLGDVDGDGYGDVVVGSWTYTNDQSGEGRVFVWHGSAAGLGANGTPANADWFAESDQVQARLGYAAAAAGDVNGDGYGDLLAGALYWDGGETDEGGAFVWHGGPGGLGANGSPANADWSAESNQADALLGNSVSTAGDVDGDGYSDVVVAVSGYDQGELDEGWCLVWHGGPTGLGTNGTPANADWSAQMNQAGSGVGSVACAGDVNGDGYADVALGSGRYDNGQSDEGRALIWFGGSGGLGSLGSPANADWFVESDQVDAHFATVATAGDVNGDGYSDVLVGAVDYDNGQSNEGKAFAYYGSGGGLSSVAGWSLAGQPDLFGFSVASAGDVNGDGYADVVVGHAHYTSPLDWQGRVLVYHGGATGLSTSPAWTVNGEHSFAYLGTSVAGAGDVNGDGFSDVIVGAPEQSPRNGKVFAYHGSAAGLGLTPAWTVSGDQVDCQMGNVVAGAGDVNGDGYSDVIVSAPLYDNGQDATGRAYVYLGSGTGLRTFAAWTAEGDQFQEFFGRSVATAGDVNGDGFSDVIVGASYYDNGQLNEGVAYVYHGSVVGLATSPNWTVEGNLVNLHLGESVATAGDVNGDGFSDAMIGSVPTGGAGLVQVYAGSAFGLSLSPLWTSTNNQNNDGFGYSVATAGDVNGDGFSDVVVGAYAYDSGQINVGRAAVYHGSSTGLSANSQWTAEGDQTGDLFGHSVASAGDVNGDGFADIIVGAPGDNGGVFAYLGNGGACRETRPRQLRTDGVTLIAPLGSSFSSTDFRLQASMLSIYGRTRLQTECEVKPLGIPFDGFGTVTDAFTDIGSDGRIDLDRLVSDVWPGTPYHWRVRAKYDQVRTPFQPYGPWLHMPTNGWNEADLRTGGVWFPPPDAWSSSWEAESGVYPDDGCPWVLSNDADPEAPVLSDGLLTLATSENPENMYYLQSTDLAISEDVFLITARMRVASETHTTGNPRRGVSISFTVAPDRANFLWFGVDEIFLWSANGVQGPTAFVDTDNFAHIYTIRVLNKSAITVYQDGSPILSGAVLDSPAYADAPEIYWGDGSGNARAVSEWEYFQHNANTVNCPPTIGVEPGSNGGLSFELRARGVNPGRGRCEVMLSLERPSRIQADVLDVTGRVVATVAQDAPLAAGHHMLSWDGRNGVGARAPAGVYFVRVRRDADSRVRRAVLLR